MDELRDTHNIIDKPKGAAADVRLRLDNIRKEFPDRGGQGTVAAVQQVDLDILAGEFVTLLGPSGCGKTTTLRLIAGFEIPTRGRILLNGQDITQQPPNKRDMALVFQNYALFPHMTVYDNVAYGLHTQRMPGAQIRDKVAAALGMMGLGQLGARKPNQLSGGQQQRVALARSLVMEPAILLFDEPLSNLDAKLRVQMRGEIHRLQRRLGITSIYVTHDQVEAMALSDRVVVMNLGLIEQVGTPEEIYRYPATRFVADFIGRANFFETRVESVSSSGALVELLGRRVEVPMQTPLQAGDQVTAMLRPEALALRAEADLLPVTVEQAMYLGSEIEYVVSAGGQAVTVVEHDPRAHLVPEGAVIGLTFAPGSVHLIPA